MNMLDITLSMLLQKENLQRIYTIYYGSFSMHRVHILQFL